MSSSDGATASGSSDKVKPDSSKDDENLDQYSSIEAYLAYMAKNIDPALAKFRNKDQASANQETAEGAETLGENAKSGQDDSAKATKSKNKNENPKKTTGNQPADEKDKKQDSATKDDKEKTTEDKYPGADECQEEIENWFRQAKQWGIDNGFPDIDKEVAGGDGVKTS